MCHHKQKETNKGKIYKMLAESQNTLRHYMANKKQKKKKTLQKYDFIWKSTFLPMTNVLLTQF